MSIDARAGRTLVTVGFPIRNGGDTLQRAIDSVTGQTHKDLEIILSDNCSADSTAEICRRAERFDPRIRFFQQPSPLSGLDNFRFVFEQARGEYFMWAAHDDLRTPNYVEVLLEALEGAPDASLAFTDAVSCPAPDLAFQFPPDPFFCDLETVGLPFAAKLRKQAYRGCIHIYGLVRTASLRGYPWYQVERSPDRPLLNWLLACGDFVRAEGGRFLYFNPGKGLEQSASEQFFRPLPRLSRERTVWASARAVSRGLWLQRRRWVPASLVFAALYVWEARGWRNTLYRWMPHPLRRFWALLKRRAGR